MVLEQHRHLRSALTSSSSPNKSFCELHVMTIANANANANCKSADNETVSLLTCVIDMLRYPWQVLQQSLAQSSVSQSIGQATNQPTDPPTKQPVNRSIGR